MEIFTPTLGLHHGETPQDLRPGYTPDAYNFVWNGGYITPRSGLSQFKGGTSKLSGAALGAWRMQSVAAEQFLVGASSRTLAVYDPSIPQWSALSYQLPSGWSSAATPSGTSVKYWDATHIYDAASNANLAVLTNDVDPPFVFNVSGSVATFSNLTDFLSLASRAVSVCAFDNRLVWFNVKSTSSTFPTRVMWSPRGLPRNYQLIDGAGFEELLDMAGHGQKVVPESDGLLLFTDEEIWRGRPRGDAYVFDFYPIQRQFGCPYPNTIVRTPAGTMFVGRDLELYVVRSDSVQPVGPAEEGGASRIQSFLRGEITNAKRMWATYSPQEQRYELYYTAADSSEGYPKRALYYSLLDRSFLPQRLNHELSTGVDYTDPGQPQTWDLTTATWDEIVTAWDDMTVSGSDYYINAFSSSGTAYHFNDAQTSDDGSAFTAQWTSHALNNADHLRYEQLTDLWVDYKANSASNISVLFGDDLDFYTQYVANVSLPAGSSKRVHVPGHAAGVSPYFRVQITDGSRPKLARFQAKLSDSGVNG